MLIRNADMLMHDDVLEPILDKLETRQPPIFTPHIGTPVFTPHIDERGRYIRSIYIYIGTPYILLYCRPYWASGVRVGGFHSEKR